MSYEFRSIVARGEAMGELMEAAKDRDGNYVLFHPADREFGTVYKEHCVRVRSSEEARRMIEEEGYSMRMRIVGSSAGSGSMIQASRIVITRIELPARRLVQRPA